jgi:hypothetical protein
MKKVVRDGKVAVLISDGWGAGFHSWGAPVEAIFDPILVDLIENEKISEAITYVEATYPDAYNGSVEELVVQWIPEGTKFLIIEYDGNESLMIQDTQAWITA